MTQKYDLDTLYEVCEELEVYASMEGTELGEACEKLINLVSFGDYVSEEFELALHREIHRMLEFFKENTTIVENEFTSIVHTKDLEWND